MSGVNKAILLGRLGRDPELRYLQNGTPVCKLNMCTSEKYMNKNNELVETAEWHRVTVWGKRGEAVSNYSRKGSLLYIEGKLKTSSYDKDGQKHWTTEIVAADVQFCDSKGNRSEVPQETGQENPKQNHSGARQQVNNSNPPGSDEGPMPDFNDFGGNPGDDDIPF
jgi:single-strand DNA-binding protein